MISNRMKSASPIRKTIGATVGRPVDERRIDNQKADIINYIENGFNIREVAIFTNCNCQALSKWLVRNKGDRDVQRALIKALIKESGRSGIDDPAPLPIDAMAPRYSAPTGDHKPNP